MAHPSPSPGGSFVVPGWWTDSAFNLSEVSQFLDSPISTVSLWITFARASGHTVGDRRNGRPLYSPADVFALALIAKLRIRHVRITAEEVADSFKFATENGRPRPEPYNGDWTVFDDGASLRVPAWLCWTAVRAWASKFFGTSHV